MQIGCRVSPRVFHATIKCFWAMKSLHSARKSTACSPGTAQIVTIPSLLHPAVPRARLPPRVCGSRETQGCRAAPSLPGWAGTGGVSRAWISHGCAPLGLRFASSKVTSVCSSALSSLLCYWGEMKFRAALFCLQLVEISLKGENQMKQRQTKHFTWIFL